MDASGGRASLDPRLGLAGAVIASLAALVAVATGGTLPITVSLFAGVAIGVFSTVALSKPVEQRTSRAVYLGGAAVVGVSIVMTLLGSVPYLESYLAFAPVGTLALIAFWIAGTVAVGLWLFTSFRRRPPRRDGLGVPTVLPIGRVADLAGNARTVETSQSGRWAADEGALSGVSAAEGAQPNAQPLEARFCSACGARITAGARFCHGCGTELGAPNQKLSGRHDRPNVVDRPWVFRDILTVGGGVLLAMGPFLPFIEASAAFVGTVSRNGIELTRGEAFIVVVLGALVAFLGLQRTASRVATILPAVVGAGFGVYYWIELDQRVADLSATELGFGSIGMGLLMVFGGAAAAVLGSLTRPVPDRQGITPV